MTVFSSPLRRSGDFSNYQNGGRNWKSIGKSSNPADITGLTSLIRSGRIASDKSAKPIDRSRSFTVSRNSVSSLMCNQRRQNRAVAADEPPGNGGRELRRMSLRSHIQKRLLDLLEEHRVVVWYDGEKAFGEIATSFAAPSCTLILAEESPLRARRAADEIVARLNDVNFPDEKNRNVLIYAPWRRGTAEEERLNDPLEAFALIGAAFGDKEAESFQSLARQAMPERIAEIDRLFSEG